MNKIVLNVGGGSRNLPPEYDGWQQDLLDIDQKVNPDICCDALELSKHTTKIYDAVYMSHALEHFYKHDVPVVLDQCLRVLKPGGYIELHVPDIKKTITEMLSRGLDIDDVWYRLGDGRPVTFHDTIHGWNEAMSAGNLYYAHKCSFTPLSLCTALQKAGFVDIQYKDEGGNMAAFGFKKG